MAHVTVQIRGQRELLALFDKFPEITMEEAIKGLERSGYEFEKIAKDDRQKCRVDTGRYRASIGHWTGGLIKPNPKASAQDAYWKLRVGR